MSKRQELGYAALAGLIFAVGLAISGMTLPEKVLGFLDVSGDWDPSLAFVMGGAIAVHMTAQRLLAKRGKPLLAEIFHLPTRSDVDAKLLVGSALFGVGWGLGGFCPGPALVSAAAGQRDALLFVVAMTVGMLLQHATTRPAVSSARPSDAPSPSPSST
jgi:uncharacterized membrane protein YedE/YeeE